MLAQQKPRVIPRDINRKTDIETKDEVRSCTDIPHKGYDRLKAREFIRQKQLERREKELLEQKKILELESLKKKKMLELKEKTQKLVKQNVLKKHQTVVSPKIVNEESAKPKSECVENKVISTVQQMLNGKQFDEITNAAIKQCFNPKSIKMSSNDPFNFMWAIKMKLSLNEKPNEENNKTDKLKRSLMLTSSSSSVSSSVETLPSRPSVAATVSHCDNPNSSVSDNCVNTAIKTLNKMISDEDKKSNYLNKMLKIKEECLTKNLKDKLVHLELEKKKLKESGKTGDVTQIKRKQKRVVFKMQRTASEIAKLRKVQKTATQHRKNFLMEQHDLMKLQFGRSCSEAKQTLKAISSKGDQMENSNLLDLLSDKDEISEQMKSLNLQSDINQILNDSELQVEIVEDINERRTSNELLMLKSNFRNSSRQSSCSNSTVEVYESDFHEVNISRPIFVVIVLVVLVSVIVTIWSF